MENATKALLIAAGVLIGLMIISLGVTLFSSLRKYVEVFHEDAALKETQQFNVQFTKFINYDDEAEEKTFTLTIQDIVTAANTAYENNISYDLVDATNNGDNYRVTIKLDGKTLEKDINSNSAEILLNGLGKEYKCSLEDVKFSTTTGRVYEVNFHEYVEL